MVDAPGLCLLWGLLLGWAFRFASCLSHKALAHLRIFVIQGLFLEPALVCDIEFFDVHTHSFARSAVLRAKSRK